MRASRIGPQPEALHRGSSSNALPESIGECRTRKANNRASHHGNGAPHGAQDSQQHNNNKLDFHRRTFERCPTQLVDFSNITYVSRADMPQQLPLFRADLPPENQKHEQDWRKYHTLQHETLCTLCGRRCSQTTAETEVHRALKIGTHSFPSTQEGFLLYQRRGWSSAGPAPEVSVFATRSWDLPELIMRNRSKWRELQGYRSIPRTVCARAGWRRRATTYERVNL